MIVGLLFRRWPSKVGDALYLRGVVDKIKSLSPSYFGIKDQYESLFAYWEESDFVVQDIEVSLSLLLRNIVLLLREESFLYVEKYSCSMDIILFLPDDAEEVELPLFDYSLWVTGCRFLMIYPLVIKDKLQKEHDECVFSIRNNFVDVNLVEAKEVLNQKKEFLNVLSTIGDEVDAVFRKRIVLYEHELTKYMKVVTYDAALNEEFGLLKRKIEEELLRISELDPSYVVFLDTDNNVVLDS